jgi:hypothetical protein
MLMVLQFFVVGGTARVAYHIHGACVRFVASLVTPHGSTHIAHVLILRLPFVMSMQLMLPLWVSIMVTLRWCCNCCH